jgi:hypothetical protein
VNALHFTPQHVINIIESDAISPEQLRHARRCENCNSWLRAFAAVASAGGKQITFQIPRAFRLQISKPGTVGNSLRRH